MLGSSLSREPLTVLVEETTWDNVSSNFEDSMVVVTQGTSRLVSQKHNTEHKGRQLTHRVLWLLLRRFYHQPVALRLSLAVEQVKGLAHLFREGGNLVYMLLWIVTVQSHLQLWSQVYYQFVHMMQMH